MRKKSLSAKRKRHSGGRTPVVTGDVEEDDNIKKVENKGG